MEDSARAARKRLGTTLARKWRLDGVLGTGGMATVYTATHRNGSRVAIKMLHRDLSSDPDARKRFLQEAYAANAVKHPGALRILDDDVTDDGEVFLVMDLLDGETLEALLERRGGGLEPAKALVIVHRLLDVLAAAHEAGVLHRDVKPSNVFICTTGVVYLLDFGIARLRELESAIVTRTGVSLGTPAFMAPEQARGDFKDLDARSDIWAVGATLFNALAGRGPHEATSVMAVIVNAATKPVSKIADVVSDLPPELAAIVDRALAFDKADRFSSAREMQRAIAEVYPRIGEGPLPDVVPRGIVSAPPPRDQASMPGDPAWSEAPTLAKNASGARAEPRLETLGGSTTGSVSDDARAGASAPTSSGTAPQRRRPLWIVAPIALVATAALAVVALSRDRARPPASSSAEEARPQPSAQPSSPEPAQSGESAPSSIEVRAADSASTASAAAASASTEPSIPRRPNAAARPAPHAPPVAAPTAPTAPPVVAPAVSAPRPAAPAATSTSWLDRAD